jgi:hypothetical protein
VTRTAELIGGPAAYGRVGQVWKLYNTRARFLVQDTGVATGLDVYGGNLIDADLVRDGSDGTNGSDLFRETFPIVAFRVPKAQRVELVSDGRNGGAAIVRVHAVDAPSGILPILDDLAAAANVDITTDYVLDPDVPWLKIVTTAHGQKGGFTNLAIGDFLSFGKGLQLFTPERGFSDAMGTAAFLAGLSDRTSYAYVYPKADVSYPIVDASGTAGLLGQLSAPSGQSASFERYLVIGSGDHASVAGNCWKLRGVTTMPIGGTVHDASGAPAAGASVVVMPNGSHQAITQAWTDADGKWSAQLPAGDYVATAVAVGHPRGTPVPVVLGGTTDLTIGALGQVRITVDAPAKASFAGSNVEAPDPAYGSLPGESEAFGLHRAVNLLPGTTMVPLKPGTYTMTVSRGVEYERVVQTITTDADVSVQLVRSVDTTGWVSGDFHQHTIGSIDSGVSPRDRVIENLAEGVEVPISSDHDNAIDFLAEIQSLGMTDWATSLVGNEISVNAIGHFNAYPIAVDPADPFAKVGAKYWVNKTIPDLVAQVRTEPEPTIFHISHPRSGSFKGYFNYIKWDPISGQATETGQSLPPDFDAIEVNESIGTTADFLPDADAMIQQMAQTASPGSGTSIPVMRDWFALLNMGRPVAALGNSDTHNRNGGTGYPRNFLYVGTDDPKQVDSRAIVNAVRAQKVVVSQGPFVTVTIDGALRMGLADPVDVQGRAASGVPLHARVQAPSWVVPQTIEVYANGRPLPLAQTGPTTFTEDAAGTSAQSIAAGAYDIVVKPQRDTWYVVVVRGSGDLMPVNSRNVLGYTNPIYLDVNGGGFEPPGLQ